MARWAALLLAMMVTAWLPVSLRADDAATGERAPFSEFDQEEIAVVRSMLASPDWPFRAIALARLDRYMGEDVEALVRSALADSAWQVKCFALRQAQRLGMQLAAEAFQDETDARVIRAAVRLGFVVPADQLDPLATRLLNTRTIDDLMLGIELAAYSESEKIRSEAGVKMTRLAKNMDDAIAALVGARLSRVLDLPLAIAMAQDFHQLLRERGGALTLPSRLPGQAPSTPGMRSTMADMSAQQFARLRDYLGSLRQRDLDLVLVMDATSSMLPMVNEARAGVDGLILYMNELSRSMRLAFIAYRDNDNKPVWEGERFTDNVNTIRDFLFKLRITGGADLPEAVCDGVCACRSLNWRRESTRLIILIGDAPYHAEDESKLFRELEWNEQRGTVVHALHVPMRFPRGYLERLPAQQAAQLQLQNEAYNTDTREKFERIAAKANGRCATVNQSGELVPAIMHCTIDPHWHAAFDEFYRLYLELCR